MKTIKWDGKPVSVPGMYAGIDIDAYHSATICDGPSISSSGLRQIFNDSPAHFFANWRGNPDRIEPSEGRHFVIGRAAHHLHLGQKNFSSLFVVEPEEYEGDGGEMKKWNNNAKDCQLWHKRQRAAGKSVLKAKEAEMIIGMATELGRNPIVAHGALDGLIERSLFWRDDKTGIWLKSRPDAIPNDSGDFADLKSCQSVKWTDLVRSIGDFGYHAQGALVRQAAREVFGFATNFSFALIFQEKSRPYCVRVVTLKDSDLDRGDQQNRIALDTFAKCLKERHWPGPGGDKEDAEFIEMSDYMQKNIDDRIKFGIS